MKELITLTAEKDLGRIDKLLGTRLTDYSRSQVQQWLKEQLVLVNDVPVKANYKVKKQDLIKIEVPRIGADCRKHSS